MKFLKESLEIRELHVQTPKSKKKSGQGSLVSGGGNPSLQRCG
jgi:hypothetical protein